MGAEADKVVAYTRVLLTGSSTWKTRGRSWKRRAHRSSSSRSKIERCANEWRYVLVFVGLHTHHTLL